MIREGDKVAPFFNMGRHATVVSIKEVKNQTWMVGGAAGKSRVAVIRFEDNEEYMEYPISDLMPLK